MLLISMLTSEKLKCCPYLHIFMMKMHVLMSMFPNYKGKCLKSQRKLSHTHTHTHSVVTPIKSSSSLIFLPISPLIKSNLRLRAYLRKSDPSHAKGQHARFQGDCFVGASLSRSSAMKALIQLPREESALCVTHRGGLRSLLATGKGTPDGAVNSLHVDGGK